MNYRRTWRERFMTGEVEFAAIWDEVEIHQSGGAFPWPMQQWLGLSCDEFDELLSDPAEFKRQMLQRKEQER